MRILVLPDIRAEKRDSRISKMKFINSQIAIKRSIMDGFDKYIESNSLIKYEEDDYDKNIDSSGHAERLSETGRKTVLWTDCGGNNPGDSRTGEKSQR